MTSTTTPTAIVVERDSDSTSFFLDDQFVGHCTPSWDPSTYPCRIGGWFAFDERPQVDGRTAANLGVYRRREAAEAVVRRVLDGASRGDA